MILVLVQRSDDLQTFFSCLKAALDLPMRAFTSACAPTSSPFRCYDAGSVIEALHLIQRRTSQHSGSICDRVDLQDFFLSLMDIQAQPTQASATALVFSFILCRVSKRWARSSVYSKSSNCLQSVHWMPFRRWVVDVFITQSIVRRNITGDSRHPWLTPVFTSRV